MIIEQQLAGTCLVGDTQLSLFQWFTTNMHGLMLSWSIIVVGKMRENALWVASRAHSVVALIQDLMRLY